jgi:hypothetical protein
MNVVSDIAPKFCSNQQSFNADAQTCGSKNKNPNNSL